MVVAFYAVGSGGLQPAERKGLITLLMSAAGKTC